MSYEVSLVINTGKHDVQIDWPLLGITFNLRDMLNKAFEAEYWKEVIDGKVCKLVSVIVEEALSNMKSQDIAFKKLNPANGYGNYHTAIMFLENLKDACNENPKARIRVC